MARLIVAMARECRRLSASEMSFDLASATSLRGQDIGQTFCKMVGQPIVPHETRTLHLQLRPIRLGPVDVVELSARLVNTLVGMGPEVVALSLQEVLREA